MRSAGDHFASAAPAVVESVPESQLEAERAAGAEGTAVEDGAEPGRPNILLLRRKTSVNRASIADKFVSVLAGSALGTGTVLQAASGREHVPGELLLIVTELSPEILGAGLGVCSCLMVVLQVGTWTIWCFGQEQRQGGAGVFGSCSGALAC